MTSDIKSFVSYLRDVKKTSRNTEISYQRDLMQLKSFLEDKGITEVEKVTKTSLNSYILFLEKEGKATTTISRELASMKAFFNFMFKEGRIRKDPAELLKAPKIEKKAPVILSVNEVNALLDQLYATGIRVSELIGLELSDLNMQVGYITCRDGQKERMVPFGKPAKQALSVYLEKGRSQLLKGKESQWLFTNCSGKAMSRQGFWKIIKYYGEKAGIQADITPHTLRHSFAAHLIRGGADIHAVQAMLGHSDSTTTHMYAAYSGNTVGETYRAALPRK